MKETDSEDWLSIAQLDAVVKDYSKRDSFVEAIFTVDILKFPVQHDHIQLLPKEQRLSFMP